MKALGQSGLEDIRASQMARTPLGIVGLFIVLVYAIGSLAFALQSDLNDGQQWVLVAFVVVFPLIVLGCFLYLLTTAFGRMYAPQDFRTDEGFMAFVEVTHGLPKVKEQAAPQDGVLSLALSVDEALTGAERPASEPISFDPETLEMLMLSVHAEQKGLFLGHVVSRETGSRPVWEVAIFVTGWGLSKVDVVGAQFFFGSAWKNRIYDVEPDPSGKTGIVVRVNNGFLAFCRVRLGDGSEVLLRHYCNLGPGEGIADASFSLS